MRIWDWIVVVCQTAVLVWALVWLDRMIPMPWRLWMNGVMFLGMIGFAAWVDMSDKAKDRLIAFFVKRLP